MVSTENMQAFKLSLVRKGMKGTTINGHVGVITRALPFIGNIDSYLLSMSEKSNPNYINSIISSLRVYGQFIKDDKLAKLPFFKSKTRYKAVMNEKEILDFLSLPCETKGMFAWHYKKNTLFWKCLAYSGARTGEISTLITSRVDLGRGLFIVDGKMGIREVAISPILFEDIREWIKSLPGEYLFPSMRTDRPMEKSAWNFDFKQRLKRLGIKRENLTPYSLRHSFITRNVTNMDLFRLQDIVGHKSITTTAGYVHLSSKSKTDSIKKDSLSRQNLSFDDRYKFFRDNVRELLTNFALSVDEERNMIKSLGDNFF